MKALRHYVRMFFSQVPVLAYVLTDRSISKSIVLTLRLWAFLVSRKTFLKGKADLFKFAYKKRNFKLELKSGIDVAVLIEVFVLFEYDWKLANDPKTILDLGAHWGDTAVYYALEYPEAKIFSVEPSPEVFARLQQQVAQFVNVVPISGALGNKDEGLEFYVSQNSLGNSLTKRSESDEKIQIRVFGMEELCRLCRVGIFDLVKFDIEGGEKYIFSDPTIKTLAKAFIGEIHLDLMDYSLEDVKKYFADFDTEFQEINPRRYILKAKKI